MRKKLKQLMGVLLSLALVLGLMPGMSLTAYAATETYTNLMNNRTVVKFNNHDWYIIADDSTATGGTVTLLAADTSFGTSAFDSTSPYSNAYSSSTVKGVLDALTAEGGAFASVKDAIADTDLSDVGVTGAKLYLLSTSEAEPYKDFNFSGAQYGGWWLRSQGRNDYLAAFVDGGHGLVNDDGSHVEEQFGVRPALKLNLSSVIFSSDTKTFTVGAASTYSVTITAGSNMTKTTTSGEASQTDLSGAMTDVVYNADEGYKFPNTSDAYTPTNGINITLTYGGKVLKVSGTPTADTSITLPDAYVAVTGVALDPGDVTVAVGDTRKLTATITPDNAAIKQVIWRASGEVENIAFYSDEACTKPVELETTTDLLTVYIKGVKESSNPGIKIDVDSVDALGTHASCYVTVNRANAVPAKLTANNRTYDGTEKPLVNVDNSTLVGGEMQYALGTETEATEPYTTSIPTKTDAGTYHVWYKAVGDESHNDSEPACVKATIAQKAAPTPKAPSVTYTAHVQGKGTLAAVKDGVTAGTVGESRRLEAVTAKLSSGTIEYRSHVQGAGWEKAWAKDGAQSGTVGKAKRLEAIQMRLDSDLSDDFSVWYRVHSQTFGWMGWARDGEAAGTSGLAKRVEAYEVVVLPKGQVPEGYKEGQASYVAAVKANAHVQGTGWTGARSALAFGTTGQARRLEALRMTLSGLPVSGGVSYEVHAQGRGWMGYKADGALAGTVGQARRLEAVRIKLTGDAAKSFSVWYRVHCQSRGWLGWAHDGADAGTTGLAKRAEAVEVQVLPKGQVPSGYDASKAACVGR